MPLRLGRDHGLDRFEQPAQRVAMAPRSPYIEGSPSLTAASHCCGVISARSPNRPDPALIVRPHPCCMPWDASIKTFFIFEERLADARSGQFPDWPAVPVELASGGLVDDRPDPSGTFGNRRRPLAPKTATQPEVATVLPPQGGSQQAQDLAIVLQRRWAAGYSVDSFCSVLSAAQLTYSLCVSFRHQGRAHRRPPHTSSFDMYAGRRVALRAPLAARAQPERHVPRRQHSPGGHLGLR